MKEKRMTHTHKRFLLSYLLFACVFIVTYIPIYNYAHGIIYKNVCSHTKSVLARSAATLDASVSVVLNGYNATSKDNRFLSLRYSNSGNSANNPVLLGAMVDTLRYSFLPGDLVTDAGLFRSASWAVTNKRSYYSDSFYSFYPDFLSCQGKTFEEWAALLSSGGSRGKWLPEMQYQSYDHVGAYSAIAYGCSWISHVGHAENPTVFFALLNTEPLLATLVDNEILEDGHLIIRDSLGNVVLTRGVVSAAEGREILTHKSTETGFEIELGLSQEYMYRQLEPLESMIILYIVIFCAVALVLVFVFSHHSATPMKRLIYAVSQAGLPEGDKIENNRHFGRNLQQDYDLVASGIHLLSDRLKSHTEIIQGQTEKLRDHLFNRALQHALYNPRDRQDFQQLFPDFPSPFCLAMVRCEEEKESIDEMAHISSAVLQAAHAVLDRIYYAHMLASGALLLVLQKGQPSALKMLRKKLQEEARVSVRSVLTQSYQDASELSVAFEQVQCMDLMPASGEVVTYADFTAAEMSHVSMPLTFSSLHEMYEALATSNETLARIILNDCTDTLLRHPDQLMMARHTHSMISHMLAQLKMEYPTALFNVVIPSFDARNLEMLFRQDLPSCLHCISVSLLEMQTDEEDLPTKVLQFINENIFSNELCVTYVADRFGIAKATLQKIIKLATGTTFSVYVGTQRLERAYRLMQEPGVSVQKVSEMCGFSSTNSFYKAFRRKYGVAPSAVTGVDDGEEESEALEHNDTEDPLDE